MNSSYLYSIVSLRGCTRWESSTSRLQLYVLEITFNRIHCFRNILWLSALNFLIKVLLIDSLLVFLFLWFRPRLMYVDPTDCIASIFLVQFLFQLSINITRKEKEVSTRIGAKIAHFSLIISVNLKNSKFALNF